MNPRAKKTSFLSNATRVKFGFMWPLMADPDLSPSAKCAAVALVFKFHNNRRDLCNPSFVAIGRIVGRKRRSTIDAVQELQDAGWLRVRSTKGGSKSNTNNFVFDFSQRERVQPTAPLKDDEPVQSTAPDPVQPTAPVHENAEGVQSTAHEPLRTTPPTGEGVYGNSQNASAPSGASHEERFQELFAIWRVRPWQEDSKKQRIAFNTACDGEDPETIIASAAQWASAVPPRYLPALEKWLATGTWRNPPPRSDNNQRRGGKRSGADIAMDMCRDELEREEYQ